MRPAPVIALFALVVVAMALLCAGLYALFGKPSRHAGKKRKQNVVNGFQLGGGIVLGIILMGSLVACSQTALGIGQSTRLSRVAAFFIAVASLVLIFSMIHHWAKHFAGWVGYSAWNGLFMVSSGHLVNNPSILVPRWWSVSATVLIFTSGLVCLRFAKKYVLNAADKAALMTWLLAVTFGIDVESTHAVYREQFALGAMLVGSLALVVAWWYHRATRHRRPLIAPMQRSAQHGHS